MVKRNQQKDFRRLSLISKVEKGVSLSYLTGVEKLKLFKRSNTQFNLKSMILFQNLIILFMCGRDMRTIILFHRIFKSTGYWISKNCMANFLHPKHKKWV